MNSSRMAPEFVPLTTILGLELKEIRKYVTESVIGISAVIKGPALIKPNSIWIFI